MCHVWIWRIPTPSTLHRSTTTYWYCLLRLSLLHNKYNRSAEKSVEEVTGAKWRVEKSSAVRSERASNGELKSGVRGERDAETDRAAKVLRFWCIAIVTKSGVSYFRIRFNPSTSFESKLVRLITPLFDALILYNCKSTIRLLITICMLCYFFVAGYWPHSVPLVIRGKSCCISLFSACLNYMRRRRQTACN